MAAQSSEESRFCFECGNEVRPSAYTCPSCGVLLRRGPESSRPALALALNFFFPGVGLMMYEQMALGIVFLVLTIISLYFLWPILMPISLAMTASSAFAPRPTGP